MRHSILLSCACIAAMLAIAQIGRADDKAPAKSASDSGACTMCDAAAANSKLDCLKKLAGTWTSEKPGPDGKPMVIEFKVTAAGTAVQETMFPGSAHEMVNMYAMDGDRLLVTHYCAMGVQPRMKLATADDRGTMNFEFVDSTNLKSRNDPHMDSLTIKLDGDKITETWNYFEAGKTTHSTDFELKRKA